MLLRDLIEQAFGSLVAQQAPEWADSSADLLGFVVNPQLPEFRSRNGSSFQVGARVTAGNVNPTNIVLFNPATSRVMAVVFQFAITPSAALEMKLFGLAADPALAAAATPLNKLLGGPAAKCLHEEADAATPTNTGVLSNLSIFNGQAPFPQIFRPIVMPPGTGINFQIGTSAALHQWTFEWDELPL